MNLKSALIIDDSQTDQYLMKRLLTKLGVVENIYQEFNGKDGLEFLEKASQLEGEFKETFPPQVIFLDINMPLINGFEFLERINNLREENSVYESIVVIMYSSSDREDGKSKALSYDFVADYIVKATNKKELQEVLEKHFG